MAIFCFLVWFYPVDLYRNMQQTDSVDIRSFHTLLLVLVTFLVASSLAHMLYAFCGILAGPDALPGFWIFMYRVNPFTYLVSRFMATTLGQATAYCADTEFQYSEPANETCEEYHQEYAHVAGGYLRNKQATHQCQYCQIDSTDQFLGRINAIGTRAGEMSRRCGVSLLAVPCPQGQKAKK